MGASIKRQYSSYIEACQYSDGDWAGVLTSPGSDAQ